MLKIESILNHIKNSIKRNDERYVIIDDEHVLDSKTGIKLHIYDDWFKVTRNDVVVATMRDFDLSIEQPIVWEIKALITEPDVMEQKKLNYMPMIKDRREKLSGFFEFPVALKSENIELEVDAEEYMG